MTLGYLDLGVFRQDCPPHFCFMTAVSLCLCGFSMINLGLDDPTIN